MPHLFLSKKEAEELISCMEFAGQYTEQNINKPLYNKLTRVLKPIKTSSAKGKGRALQQWVCKRISEITGIPYNQQEDQCPIHSREMGQSGTDIILRGEALERFPYAVECKSGETFQLVNTVEQAKNNIGEYEDWLIVHRRKAWRNPIVIMDWYGFEKLVDGRF